MVGLEPIKLLPARERVASVLRKAIIARQIPAGETMTLENIAHELGVSITPVREAFQILSRDGLIELRQSKGAVVLGMTEKTIREHYQVRAAIEGAACAICVNDKKDISAVEHCYHAAAQALERRDSGKFSNYNQAFHVEIWTACENEKLKKMASELWNGLSMGIKTTEEEYANNSQREHGEILDALHGTDPETARRIMEKHILRSMEDVMTRYV